MIDVTDFVLFMFMIAIFQCVDKLMIKICCNGLVALHVIFSPCYYYLSTIFKQQL